MRLSSQDVDSIKSIVQSVDPLAKIVLFGSRTKDTEKGGDIDLYIESKTINDTLKRSIKIKLYDSIGEQKIDIVLSEKVSPEFKKIILKEGIPL